jgi:transcriptional regulator with GAF, ATPase, and Fis domain
VAEATSRFALLYELGCAFAARLELEDLVPLVMGRCRDVLAAEGAALLLLDDGCGELYFPYVDEEDPDVADRLAGLRFPADQGIAGAVLSTGQPQRIDDVRDDPRFYADIDRHTGLTTRCLLSAPLVTRHGVIGVLEVVNPVDRPAFTQDDLDLLTALSGSVAIALENARLWADMKGSAARLEAKVGALRRDLERRDRFGGMVGSAASMADVFRLMDAAATSPITVLIEGETGTGKELVAQGIHKASARADEPFVAVNCAAVPESLLESELFGHRRGAFTGATHDRAGLFEAASGGTLLLDEVGEMTPAMQAKLLRVLQEGEVTPLGERRARRVDVRVISATNRDLLQEVKARRFRDDLYYRLGAFPIHIPPLRERTTDIPLLVERFLADAVGRHGKAIPGIEPEAWELLSHFDWPGNVRELRNEIERAVALATAGEPIAVRHLSSKLAVPRERAPSPVDVPSRSDLRDARTGFEARFIDQVLAEHGGNVSQSARALGISRVALQKKMKDHGLR